MGAFKRSRLANSSFLYPFGLCWNLSFLCRWKFSSGPWWTASFWLTWERLFFRNTKSWRFRCWWESPTMSLAGSYLRSHRYLYTTASVTDYTLLICVSCLKSWSKFCFRGSQSFAAPGWENGMNREAVLAVVNMFNPPGVSTATAGQLFFIFTAALIQWFDWSWGEVFLSSG